MKFNLEEIAKQYHNGTVVIVGNGPRLVTMPGKDAAFQRFKHIAEQRSKGIYKDINEYEQPKALVHRIDDSPHPLWTINGAWTYHPKSTMGFMMDDHKFHRPETHPQPEWYDNLMKEAQIPIMTSKYYPQYPPLVEYPIREIIKKFKTSYFGETVDYMIALAVYFGVKKLIFIGCDYQLHDRFPGERASTEYWIGKVEAMGVECDASHSENLMKPSGWEPHFHPQFYGYAKDDFPVSEQEISNLIKGDQGGPKDRRKAG